MIVLGFEVGVLGEEPLRRARLVRAEPLEAHDRGGEEAERHLARRQHDVEGGAVELDGNVVGDGEGCEARRRLELWRQGRGGRALAQLFDRSTPVTDGLANGRTAASRTLRM